MQSENAVKVDTTKPGTACCVVSIIYAFGLLQCQGCPQKLNADQKIQLTCHLLMQSCY